MEDLLRAGYQPLYMDREEEKWISYVCQKNQELFRILIISDIKAVGEIILFMLRQDCKDFVEQVYLDGCYAAVYAHRHGQSLSEKLSEISELQSQSRVEIAKNIVKEIIKKRVDCELALQSLIEKNILVEAGNQISFIYTLPDMMANKHNVFRKLSTIIGRIWRGGLSNGMESGGLNDEAADWLKKLETMQFSSIYEAYSKMPFTPYLPVAATTEEKKEEKIPQITYDGYWEFKRFYLKKKPIIIAVMIIIVLIGIIVGVVIPYLSEEGGKIWDYWSAEVQLLSVHLVKHRLCL